MYFRSSSQTKSPCGSSSGERNSDAGRQVVGGPNKDNQTVNVSNDSISGCVLLPNVQHGGTVQVSFVTQN